VDILSFVTQKYRTLVYAIGLISILQLGTLNESFLFLFYFLHQDAAAVQASEGEPLPGHHPPLWAASMLSRALLQTTGWKDFRSACGVGPPQDLPPELLSHVQCLAVCSVATNDYKDTDNCKSSLLSPRDMSAGSVRLLCLLTFQWPYSLKPPGASPETLPHHPSAVAHITWDSVL